MADGLFNVGDINGSYISKILHWWIFWWDEQNNDNKLTQQTQAQPQQQTTQQFNQQQDNQQNNQQFQWVKAGSYIESVSSPIKKFFKKTLPSAISNVANNISNVTDDATEYLKDTYTAWKDLIGASIPTIKWHFDKQAVYNDFVTDSDVYKRVNDELFDFWKANTKPKSAMAGIIGALPFMQPVGAAMDYVSGQNNDDKFLELWQKLKSVVSSPELTDVEKNIYMNDVINKYYNIYWNGDKKLEDQDYKDIAITAMDYSDKIEEVDKKTAKQIAENTSEKMKEEQKETVRYKAEFITPFQEYINSIPIETEEQQKKQFWLKEWLNTLFDELSEIYIAKQQVLKNPYIKQEDKQRFAQEADNYFKKSVPYIKDLISTYLNKNSEETDFWKVADAVAKKHWFKNFVDAIGYDYKASDVSSFMPNIKVTSNPWQYFKMKRDDLFQEKNMFDRLMRDTFGDVGQGISTIMNTVAPTLVKKLWTKWWLVNTFSPLQMADLEKVTKLALEDKNSKFMDALYSISNKLPNLLSIASDIYITHKLWWLIWEWANVYKEWFKVWQEAADAVKAWEKIWKQFVKYITKAKELSWVDRARANELITKAFKYAKDSMNKNIKWYVNRKVANAVFNFANNYWFSYMINNQFDTPYSAWSSDFFIDTLFWFTDLLVDAWKFANAFKHDPLKYSQAINDGIAKKFLNISDEEFKKLPKQTRSEIRKFTEAMVEKRDNALKEVSENAPEYANLLKKYTEATTKEQKALTEWIKKEWENIIEATSKEIKVPEEAWLQWYKNVWLLDWEKNDEVLETIYNEVWHEEFGKLANRAKKWDTWVAVEYLRDKQIDDVNIRRLFQDMDQYQWSDKEWKYKILQHNLANLYVLWENWSEEAMQVFNNKVQRFIEKQDKTYKKWLTPKARYGSPSNYMGSQWTITVNWKKYNYYATKVSSESKWLWTTEKWTRAHLSAIYTLVPADNKEYNYAMQNRIWWKLRWPNWEDLWEVRDLPKIVMSTFEGWDQFFKENIWPTWKYLVEFPDWTKWVADFSTQESIDKWLSYTVDPYADISTKKYNNLESKIRRTTKNLPALVTEWQNTTVVALEASKNTFKDSLVITKVDSFKIHERYYLQATQKDITNFILSTVDKQSYRKVFNMVKTIQQEKAEKIIEFPLNTIPKIDIERAITLDWWEILQPREVELVPFSNKIVAPQDWTKKPLFKSEDFIEIWQDKIDDIVTVVWDYIDDFEIWNKLKAKALISEPYRAFAWYEEIIEWAWIYVAHNYNELLDRNTEAILKKMIDTPVYSTEAKQNKLIAFVDNFDTTDYNTNAFTTSDTLALPYRPMYENQEVVWESVEQSLNFNRLKEKAIQIFWLSAWDNRIKYFTSRWMFQLAKAHSGFESLLSFLLNEMKTDINKVPKSFLDSISRSYELYWRSTVEDITHKVKKINVAPNWQLVSIANVETFKSQDLPDALEALSWVWYEYHSIWNVIWWDKFSIRSKEIFHEIHNSLDIKDLQIKRVSVLSNDTKMDFISYEPKWLANKMFKQIDFTDQEKKYILDSINKSDTLDTAIRVRNMLADYAILSHWWIFKKLVTDSWEFDKVLAKDIILNPNKYRDSIWMWERKYHKKLLTWNPREDSIWAGLWTIIFDNTSWTKDWMWLLKKKLLSIHKWTYSVDARKRTSKLHYNWDWFALKGLFVEWNTASVKSFILSDKTNIDIARDWLKRKFVIIWDIDAISNYIKETYWIDVIAKDIDSLISWLDIDTIAMMINNEFDIIWNEHLLKKFIKPKKDREKEVFKNVKYDRVFQTVRPLRYYLNDWVLATKNTTAPMFQQVIQNIFDDKILDTLSDYLKTKDSYSNAIEVTKELFTALRNNDVSKLKELITNETDLADILDAVNSWDLTAITNYTKALFDNKISSLQIKWLATYMLWVDNYELGLIKKDLTSQKIKDIDVDKEFILFMHKETLSNLSWWHEFKNWDKIVAIRAPVTDAGTVGAYKVIVIDTLSDEVQKIMNAKDWIYTNQALTLKLKWDFDGDLIYVYPEMSLYKKWKWKTLWEMLYDYSKDVHPLKEPNPSIDVSIDTYNDVLYYTLESKRAVWPITAQTRKFGILYNLLWWDNKLYKKYSQEWWLAIQNAVDAALWENKRSIYSIYADLFAELLWKSKWTISEHAVYALDWILWWISKVIKNDSFVDLVYRSQSLRDSLNMLSIIRWDVKKLSPSNYIIKKVWKEEYKIFDKNSLFWYLMWLWEKYKDSKWEKISPSLLKTHLSLVLQPFKKANLERLFNNYKWIWFIVENKLWDNIYSHYWTKAHHVSDHIKTKIFYDTILKQTWWKYSKDIYVMLPHTLKQFFTKEWSISKYNTKDISKIYWSWSFNSIVKNEYWIIRWLDTIKNQDKYWVVVTAILTLDPPEEITEWISKNYPIVYEAFVETKQLDRANELKRVLDPAYEEYTKKVLWANKPDMLRFKSWKWKDYHKYTSASLMWFDKNSKYLTQNTSAAIVNPQWLILSPKMDTILSMFVNEYNKAKDTTWVARLYAWYKNFNKVIENNWLLILPNTWWSVIADSVIRYKKIWAFNVSWNLNQDIYNSFKDAGYTLIEVTPDTVFKTWDTITDDYINNFVKEINKTIGVQSWNHITSKITDDMINEIFSWESDNLAEQIRFGTIDNTIDQIIESWIYKDTKVTTYMAIPDVEQFNKIKESTLNSVDNSMKNLYNECK